MQSQEYYVYILECSDKTLYCGITDNIERRIAEHNTSPRSAKYTRGRRPVRLVYSESLSSKSLALKREIEIKKLYRIQKLELISSLQN